MKPSLARDRSLLLINALEEVIGPACLDIENLLIFAQKNDAGGVLYSLNAILSRARLGQEIGRKLREVAFPKGKDIDEAIRDGADAYHEERLNGEAEA